jgi:predicted transcriptional regulator
MNSIESMGLLGPIRYQNNRSTSFYFGWDYIKNIMKYRSSTEIIDSMLRSIRSGATKTHIMYRAYMSYSQLKEYLKLLEERALIKYDAASQLYLLTEKGLKFMNAYERINELIPSINESKYLFEKRFTEAPALEKKVFEY